MRVLLSGGGTAGHINPALALAETLRDRGVEVSFAGTPEGLESRLVPQAGIPFTAYEAKGFNRNHPLTLPKALLTLNASTKQAKRDFAESRPDAVVAFGGYVCIPVGRAAESLGIPVVVHEQNSVMGMANKYLARRAQRVCLTYEHAAKDVPDAGRVLVTGNPVRQSVFAAAKDKGRAAFGIPQDALMLLVTGGSLGARHINQAMAALKDELLARPNLYVVHLTGPKELEATAEALGLDEAQRARWQLLGYTDQMGLAMAAADAVVSRAGATSLAEISARHIPALLVPFPYATEDHQSRNAEAWVEAGCALCVADDQVEGPQFREKVLRLVDDAALRASMAEASEKMGTKDAAAALADAVMEAARG